MGEKIKNHQVSKTKQNNVNIKKRRMKNAKLAPKNTNKKV